MSDGVELLEFAETSASADAAAAPFDKDWVSEETGKELEGLPVLLVDPRKNDDILFPNDNFLVADLREFKETASVSSKTDVCEALDCVRGRVSSFRGPVLSSNAAPDMYLDRRLAAAFSPVDSSSLSSEGVYCFDSLDLCVGGLQFCRRGWMSLLEPGSSPELVLLLLLLLLLLPLLLPLLDCEMFGGGT